MGTTEQEVNDAFDTMEAEELEGFDEMFPEGYTTLDEVKKHFEHLQGQHVEGGYSTGTIPHFKDLSLDTISILDFLENLEAHVVDDLDTEDILLAHYKHYFSDNSYNWGSPISNDIQFHMYRNENTSEVLVSLMVHRFGDVRGNYTPPIILKFWDEAEFFEAMWEADKHLDYYGFNVRVSMLTDVIEVYNHDGFYLGEVYDLDHENKEKFLEDLY